MEKNLILTKAQNAVLAHDWSTAARLYKELLKTDASNVDYLKELGSIYVKAGEDEKAIPYYEQIITFYPHYIEAMNSLGAIYRRLKRYDESIQILHRALEENRDIPSVNYNLGFTYKEMGNYEDAIDSFESVISENPDDVLAYNHLGSIYLAQKDYNKSITSYKRGLQVDPNHPILNYNLARCYEEAKSYPDAIRCYEIALKTRPGWTDAIQDFSKLLVKCQLTKQAQDIVEQSIKLHPTDSGLLYLLGDIYLNQFDYDNASKTFSKAEKIDPNNVRILTGLAQALENGDKVELALDKILAAMEKEPENSDIKKQYVHTLLTAQHYDQALEHVKELYENDGEKDLQVLDLYGQYYICRGDDQAANFYYDKIKKINHTYRDYMLGAANRYVQTGNYEKAEEIAKSYVSRNENNQVGHNTLGKIYEKQGNFEKAKYEYSRGTSPQNPNAIAIKGIKNADIELEKNPVSPSPVTETVTVESQVPGDAAQSEENSEAEETAVYSGSNFPPHLEAEESDIFAEDKVPGSDEEPEVENPDEEEEENTELTGLAEGVDRTKYGDNLPLSDALVEDDADFWSEFADDADKVNPFEGNEAEASEEKSDSAEDSYNPFDDSQFDDPIIEEPKFQFAPEPAAMEEAEEEIPAPVPPVEQAALKPVAQPAPQPAPVAQPYMPPEKSEYERQLEQKLQEATMNSAEHALQTALNTQKIAQQMLDEQKRLSEQFEQEKEQIKAESEKLILDTINKKMEEKNQEAQDMAEEKQTDEILAEEEIPVEEEISEETADEEIPAENATEEETAVEEDFIAEPEFAEDEQEENPEESIEENPAEEEISEEFADAEIVEESEEEIPEEEEITEEAPAEDIPTEDISEDTAEEEIAEENTEEITEEEAISEETPADDIPAEENTEEDNFDSVDEYAAMAKDSDMPQENATIRFESIPAAKGPIDEELFLTVDEIINGTDPSTGTYEEPFAAEESPVVEEEPANEEPVAIEEEAPATEEEPAIEEPLTDEEPVIVEDEAPAFEEPVAAEETPAAEEEAPAEPAVNYDVDEDKFLSTEELIQAQGELVKQEKLHDYLENSNDASIEMLGKIEQILSNPDMSKEYAEQIELFKKLRTLSTFLPEKERNSVFSCKIRVMIEYVISKMSGRPGLLMTAEELIKSGVLGAEYDDRLTVQSNKELTNELIKEVLQNMKILAQDLEDKELSKSLIISADGILEQIDLISQKGEIF